MQSHPHHSAPHDPKQRFSRATAVIFWVLAFVVFIWIVTDLMGHTPASLGTNTGAATTTAALGAPQLAGKLGATDASNGDTPVKPAAVLPRFTRGSVVTPKGTVSVEVASTDEAREQGLGSRSLISKDSGMLFVFQNAGVYGFWMKDMEFPIDMVWIGADQKVSGVAPGVSPDSYPQIFYPPNDILYVLELPAGSAASHEIATGTKLVF